jgi:hypothetical protein
LLYTGNVFMSVPLLPAIPNIAAMQAKPFIRQGKKKKKPSLGNTATGRQETGGSIASRGKDSPIFCSPQPRFFRGGRPVGT